LRLRGPTIDFRERGIADHQCPDRHRSPTDATPEHERGDP
jgi:hypothetical protein